MVRVTPRAAAPSVIVRPNGSMQLRNTNPPGGGVFFIDMTFYLLSVIINNLHAASSGMLHNMVMRKLFWVVLLISTCCVGQNCRVHDILMDSPRDSILQKLKQCGCELKLSAPDETVLEDDIVTNSADETVQLL